MQNRQTFRQPN